MSTYQIQNNPTPQWPLSSLASPSHPLCPNFPNSAWSLEYSQPLGFHSTLCRLLSRYLAHSCTHCWNLQASLMKWLFFNKWIYNVIFSITQLRYCFYFIGCLNSLACNVLLWTVLFYHCLSYPVSSLFCSWADSICQYIHGDIFLLCSSLSKLMIVIVVALVVLLLGGLVIRVVNNNHNDNSNNRNSCHLLCYLKFSQQLFKTKINKHMQKQRLREVQWLAQGHSVSYW